MMIRAWGIHAVVLLPVFINNNRASTDDISNSIATYIYIYIYTVYCADAFS